MGVSKKLPWKLKVDFDRETIDLVWLYQSIRGRRHPRTAPTRTAVATLVDMHELLGSLLDSIPIFYKRVWDKSVHRYWIVEIPQLNCVIIVLGGRNIASRIVVCLVHDKTT